MYNLTFDNPYNREIVKKLKQFRNKQQGYFVPTYIEPEHITHRYDPITITGGSINHISHSYKPGALIHYPADLYEPIHTINRNQMVGNKLKGGSSDLMERPYQIPTDFRSGTSYDRKDKEINDLGAIHSKRRGQRGFVGMKGGIQVVEPIINTPKIDIVKKLKNIKEGGKKKSKNLPEPKQSKLLKIFN